MEFRGGFFGHDAAIVRAAISRDGTRAVTVSADGAVFVWATDTLETISSMNDESASYSALGFSDDGRYVCLGTEKGMLQIWNPTTGTLRVAESVEAQIDGIILDTQQQNVIVGYENGSVGVHDLVDPEVVELVEVSSRAVDDFVVDETQNRFLYVNGAGELEARTWPEMELITTLDAGTKLAVAESGGSSRFFFVQNGVERGKLFREKLDADVREEAASVSPVPSTVTPVFSFLALEDLSEAVERFLQDDEFSNPIASFHPFIRLGLYSGDRIVSVNGVQVADAGALRNVLAGVDSPQEVQSLEFVVERETDQYLYRWIFMDPIDQTRATSLASAQLKRMISVHRRQLRETRENLEDEQNDWYVPRGIDWKVEGLIDGYVAPSSFLPVVEPGVRAMGVSPRDVIESIDGQVPRGMDNFSDIFAELADLTPGREVRIMIKRGAFRRVDLVTQISN